MKEGEFMPEESYMSKPYCLECQTKHLNRAEHHAEDLVTSAQDDPELREEAQDMLDQIRGMRKRVDELRINELARRKLEEGGI
jgi:hypothetical protein